MKNLVVFLALLPITFSASTSMGQVFGHGEIIISEFFDDILQVNQGSVTDLFDIAQNDNISHLVIGNANIAYVSNFAEIWKINLQTGSVTTLATLATTPNEITLDNNGDLIAVSGFSGVERIDTATGTITPVFDDTFFNPSDVVVAPNGDLYMTEFFDGIVRLDPGGTLHQIGNFPTNFFNRLVLEENGDLLLATTFEEDIYRVDPSNGLGVPLSLDAFTFIDDLALDLNGDLLLAGELDIDGDSLVEAVVLRIDPVSGGWSTVVDENIVGDPSPPFFNPMDITVFDGTKNPGPISFSIVTGSLDSGGVQDLLQSDNQYLVMDPAFTMFRYQLGFTVDATSPTDIPSALSLNYESRVFNIIGTIEQRLELFNYNTQQYELVDTRQTTPADSVVMVTPAGDPSRFVEAGTGAMRARVSYQNSLSFWIFVFSAFFLPFETSVDHIYWHVIP